MKKYFLVLVLGIFSVTAFAMGGDDRDAVRSAGQAWEQAIAARNLEKIAALYAKDAMVYPTFANKADTTQAVLDYFKKISGNHDLQVKFDQEHIQLYGNVAVNSGIYTFSYQKNGKEIHVPARYTFVYLHEGNAWLIVNHHSSVLPDPLDDNHI